MFCDCESFNQPLNKWNVSKVKNMANLFRNCKIFKQDLNDWNVVDTTQMSRIFHGASLFPSLENARWYSWVTNAEDFSDY